MLQTTTRKGGVRAEREDDYEDYNQEYAEDSNYDNADDVHHHHHMDGQGYSHEHERDYYYEEPVRQQYVEERVVQSGIKRHQYATNEVPRQMQSDTSPIIESNVPTSRSTQQVHQTYHQNYSETIKQPTVEPQIQSYQAYTSVKPQYETIEKPLPQQQPQVQSKSPDLDDLEAKIKAALERSEATYRRAYKPGQQTSPTKAPALEQTEPNSYLLQTPSQYYSTNYGGYDISDSSASRIGATLGIDKPSELDEASYMKQSGKNYLYSASKTQDKLSATPHPSDIPTNITSTENTFYDGISGYSSQPYAKNYTTSYTTQTYQTPTYNPTSYLVQDHTTSYTSAPKDNWSSLSGNGVGLTRYGGTDQGLYGYSSVPKTTYDHSGLASYEHQSQPQNLTQFI